jgi:hypothetical protein
MPTGIPAKSDHTALVEPWRQRTVPAVLQQKEQRIRQRVGDLYADLEKARGIATTKLVRRSLIEAEHLCDLVAAALRADWLGR